MMNRMWVRGLLLVLIGGGVGLGLLVAWPNLGVVWAKITELTHGEESKEVAAPPDATDSTDGSLASHPMGDPGFSTLAQLASIGAVDATQPALPDVVLSSPAVAERIGLKVVPVVSRNYAPSITGNAEITYNANLYGEVRARVRGIVKEVLADEGSQFRKGEPMVVIDSAEVGTTKADYLAALPVEKLARQTLDMTLALRKDNAAPLKDEMIARKDMNTATANVENARQRLHNLGLTKKDLERIESEGDTSTLLEIVAPIDGTVVDRHCVPGEAIEQTDRLFVVSNVRLMWAWIDIYEADIESVEVGQPVYFTISGTESPEFHGKVDWIDTALNPTTRTIRVRAEMENPTGRLRANEFGARPHPDRCRASGVVRASGFGANAGGFADRLSPHQRRPICTGTREDGGGRRPGPDPGPHRPEGGSKCGLDGRVPAQERAEARSGRE